MAVIQTRFAPTPSGLLHEGNALNFILTWWFARFHKGKVHLRIDDSDETRTRDIYIENIFRCIDWLGIDYDSGAQGLDDHKKNYSQVLKRDYYFAELMKYLGEENLFACECSRKDLASFEKYPDTCISMGYSLDKPKTSLRMKNTSSGEFHRMILWRKDGNPAYQLASVLEDRDLKTTHIIRGLDLLSSSTFQKELYPIFSKKQFPLTLHHELLLNQNGLKFSKSQGSRGIIEKYESPENFYKEVLWPFLGEKFRGITVKELSKTPPPFEFS